MHALGNSAEFTETISNFAPTLIRLQHLQIPSVLQAAKTLEVNKLLNKQNQQTISPSLVEPNIQQSAGSLAHLYMEMIANQGLEHWPASRIDASSQSMQFWLLQKGHAKNEVEVQLQHIITALKTTIASPQALWMLAPRPSCQAELSLTIINKKNIDEKNTLQQYCIDLTFIDEGSTDDDLQTQTKTRWIIDYKLGLDVNETNLNLAAQTHKAQLVNYSNLFKHEKLPIKTAVYFLSLGKLVEI